MVTEKREITQQFQEEEQGTYQWAKQWYPVAVVNFLDPSRPHAMQLLGNNIVLWRDGDGKWRCFEDACPHRLVPLSEGRVESDGTLLCSYHAWRFNGNGKCVSIPQSLDEQTEAKHCSSSKSCATVYPTQERQGLLWVWAESGENARLESELRTPRLMPGQEDFPDKKLEFSFNMRDLPYGWEFFVENVIDPGHVPVAHQGIIGNRYRDAKYYDMIRIRDMTTDDGFCFEVSPTSPYAGQMTYDFQPPCHVRVTSSFLDGTKNIAGLYVTPSRPGWCRHIQCEILVRNKPFSRLGINFDFRRLFNSFSRMSISNELGKAGVGLGFFGFKIPFWLTHVLSSKFMHQDMVFLRYQEKILAQRKTHRWQDVVYTPNPQDKMVIVFRKWWEKQAGFGIPWAPGCNPELPPVEQDKQKLFDVWTTHTQHCTVCQDALKNINRLTVLAYFAAFACFGLGVIMESRAIAMKAAVAAVSQTSTSLFAIAPTAGFWWALGGTVIFATVGYQLKKFTGLFYTYDFEHADND